MSSSVGADEEELLRLEAAAAVVEVTEGDGTSRRGGRGKEKVFETPGSRRLPQLPKDEEKEDDDAAVILVAAMALEDG